MVVCPVCGKVSLVDLALHRCPEKKLRNKDARHQHAELEPQGEREPTEAQRIAEGLEALEADEFFG